MRRFNNPLNHVRIAAPCSADWEQMAGNDRVRFCGQCNLNVYNLSQFSKREAEAFISSSEGRVCARFYRRADGSIVTKNCPEGLRAIRRRLSGLAKAVSATVITFFAGLGIYNLSKPAETPQPRMGGIALPHFTGGVKKDSTNRWAQGEVMQMPMGMIAIDRGRDHRQSSSQK